MVIQTLDDKIHCKGIYSNGQLLYNFDEFDFASVDATWDYDIALADTNAAIASLLCGGKTLAEVCPDLLRHRWEAANGRLLAFYKSFVTSKINLDKHCFYDLVPERFLLEFCEIKNKITKYIVENYETPDNYDFLKQLAKFTYNIRNQQLNIDYSELASEAHKLKTRNFIKKTKYIKPYIGYNIFGTKTGRLTVNKGYFPILTLDSDYRKILKPQNNYFIELDYNAAELRVLLGLNGSEQPQQDLHQWNIDNLYRGIGTREEAKKRIFAWLYNPQSKDYLSNRFYERDKVLEKYWDGSYVKTPFKRKIEADSHHALNYLIQSTTSDLVLSNAFKLVEVLKDRNSFISFTLHDSIVVDFDDSDREIVDDLLRVFSETSFGIFNVNLSAGKTYGEMKRIEWTP